MEKFLYKEITKQLNWEIKSGSGYVANIGEIFPRFTIKGYAFELRFGDHLINKFGSLDAAKLAAQEYLDGLLLAVAPVELAEVIQENTELVLFNKALQARVCELEDLQMEIDEQSYISLGEDISLLEQEII